jgi:hypothetical protein
VFSVTFDEPAHIAAGMQLLDSHEFTYEPLHPPLARIAVAFGPYLAGYRSQNGGDMWIEGRRLLYGNHGRPDGALVALARLGVLPFFVLSLAITWLWTARHFGGIPASIAVILLGNLPILLGHAGLATTDVVFTAAFLLAFFSFLSWLQSASIGRGLALGAAVALAVSAKLSTLLFLPAACSAVLAHRWMCERKEWRPSDLLHCWPSGLAAGAAFLVTIWAIYGFGTDPFFGIMSLARGVVELAMFAEGGEPSYFFGEIRKFGSWAYFPVLILVKSPLPFLIAFAIGAANLIRAHRRDWLRMAPLLGAAAIVGSVLSSTINIGLRHILPVFPLMAIVAGSGLGRLLTARMAPYRLAFAGLLLAWYVGVSAAVTPNYLAYFNELALGKPHRIVVGSDLDWGQDLNRLSAAVKERQVSRIHLAVHTSADLRKHDLPSFETMYPGEPTTGWVAISEQVHAFYCAGYRWLDAYTPVARIGSSIRLYYVPGPPAEPGPPDLLRHFNWNIPQPCSPSGR